MNNVSCQKLAMYINARALFAKAKCIHVTVKWLYLCVLTIFDVSSFFNMAAR